MPDEAESYGAIRLQRIHNLLMANRNQLWHGITSWRRIRQEENELISSIAYWKLRSHASAS